ncbi:MAG: hypothetical protein QOJ29_3402 [Thermoleophilaceae bacterium]|jgi:hypothetical protein|nr:hypothetical protein [Thermoleophilaceae bacterium]
MEGASKMISSRHNSQFFDLTASFTMVLGASGVWAYNALQFLHGLVG